MVTGGSWVELLYLSGSETDEIPKLQPKPVPESVLDVLVGTIVDTHLKFLICRQQSADGQHEAVFDFEVPGLVTEDWFIGNDEIVLPGLQRRARQWDFRRQPIPEAKLHVLAVGKRLVGPKPMGESQRPRCTEANCWMSRFALAPSCTRWKTPRAILLEALSLAP